jgi:mRNA (guanine-N7-)-methyltransferase
MKHDLFAPRTIQSLQPQFSTLDEIRQQVDETTSTRRIDRPKFLASVYTYKDAPTQPDPLARQLFIIGFCSSSLAPANANNTSGNGNSNSNNNNNDLLMTQCQLAVKRADGRYREELKRTKPKDVVNSDSFAMFCQHLRRDDRVAIVVCTKSKRAGFLWPESEQDNGGNFVARFWVGKLEPWKECLEPTRQVEVAAEVENQTDDWTPGTPPMEENGGEASWRPETPPMENNGEASWKPETPPPEEGNGEASWKPETPPEEGNDEATWKPETPPAEEDAIWKPPTTETGDQDMWEPPTNDNSSWDPPTNDNSGWDPSTSATDYSNSSEFNGGTKRPRSDSMNSDTNGNMESNSYHANSAAAQADAYYSGVKRSLDTRADSMLFHMRNFNGWVKATQIAELNPRTECDSSTVESITGKGKQKKKRRLNNRNPLRVLDLACGKGGDLGKWVLHQRKIQNYVGIDVARVSLMEAAKRARKMRDRLGNKCIFTVADLGDDVPGRPKSAGRQRLQKLLSWSLAEDDESGDPSFKPVSGGGVQPTDKFDVVSIQFAIHYMVNTRARARRFFHTVSQLLDIGGNLVATTIDTRMVLDHMMNTGFDFHQDDIHRKDVPESNGSDTVVVCVGNNACQLKFTRDTVKKIFEEFQHVRKNGELNNDLFGLEYVFTLTEGQDHAAGVGTAVDLPEWLLPLPVLTELAEEAGLSLEYASNFHEFYKARADPKSHSSAHSALYNMNVLNTDGTISPDEWEISRMYMAVKFRKDRESSIVITNDQEEEEVEEEEESKDEIEVKNLSKVEMFRMALAKAKSSCEPEAWNSMTARERNALSNAEMVKLMSR